MIKFEKTEVFGFYSAIRGMRNPMESWGKSDSIFTAMTPSQTAELNRIGSQDRKLMESLIKSGSEHSKFRRFIGVGVDITAPLYWWKEFDTYKIGTSANSCSTMYKLMDRPLTLDDFSCEHFTKPSYILPMAGQAIDVTTTDFFNGLLEIINRNIRRYKAMKDVNNDYARSLWYETVQLLPSSYNQKRTVTMNYETLANIYRQRRRHKLEEWSVGFIKWVEGLPESWIVTYGIKEEPAKEKKKKSKVGAYMVASLVKENEQFSKMIDHVAMCYNIFTKVKENVDPIV